MDDLRRLEAKGLARAKIRSRRRRVSTIRRRTVRGSLALFTVLWGVIFAQLATGNDPVLSRVKGAHTQAAASREAGKSAHSQSGAVASSAPPEPEAESELESELAPEAGAESSAEAESPTEAESPAEPEAEQAPEPQPESAPPLVTSSS